MRPTIAFVLFARVVGPPVIAGLSAPLLASAAQAQDPPYKSISFNAGKLEFQLEGVAYSALLDQFDTNLD